MSTECTVQSSGTPTLHQNEYKLRQCALKKKLSTGSICKQLQWALWSKKGKCNTSSTDKFFFELVENLIWVSYHSKATIIFTYLKWDKGAQFAVIVEAELTLKHK